MNSDVWSFASGVPLVNTVYIVNLTSYFYGLLNKQTKQKMSLVESDMSQAPRHESHRLMSQYLF